MRYGTRIVLRTKDQKTVVRERFTTSERDSEHWNMLMNEFKRQMDTWERSDQFIGRPLEIVVEDK